MRGEIGDRLSKRKGLGSSLIHGGEFLFSLFVSALSSTASNFVQLRNTTGVYHTCVNCRAVANFISFGSLCSVIVRVSVVLKRTVGDSD